MFFCLLYMTSDSSKIVKKAIVFWAGTKQCCLKVSSELYLACADEFGGNGEEINRKTTFSVQFKGRTRLCVVLPAHCLRRTGNYGDSRFVCKKYGWSILLRWYCVWQLSVGKLADNIMMPSISSAFSIGVRAVRKEDVENKEKILCVWLVDVATG